MLPAYFTAFGTTSSAVTMPVSLARGKLIPGMKESIANFVFPLCSQTHLSGAAMTITISAMTVSMLTMHAMPGFINLLLFILILSVIEVGAVGVPGGSIMAAWPVLVGVLGFQEEAMGLMFALFLIQDSFRHRGQYHRGCFHCLDYQQEIRSGSARRTSGLGLEIPVRACRVGPR